MKATDAIVILLDVIKTPKQAEALHDLMTEATENSYQQGDTDGYHRCLVVWEQTERDKPIVETRS